MATVLNFGAHPIMGPIQIAACLTQAHFAVSVQQQRVQRRCWRRAETRDWIVCLLHFFLCQQIRGPTQSGSLCPPQRDPKSALWQAPHQNCLSTPNQHFGQSQCMSSQGSPGGSTKETPTVVSHHLGPKGAMCFLTHAANDGPTSVLLSGSHSFPRYLDRIPCAALPIPSAYLLLVATEPHVGMVGIAGLLSMPAPALAPSGAPDLAELFLHMGQSYTRRAESSSSSQARLRLSSSSSCSCQCWYPVLSTIVSLYILDASMNSRQVYGRPLKANTNGAPQPAQHLAGIHGSILRQCWPILHTSNGNNLKQD